MERYRRLIRAHVYDKCWQLDITWAEVEQLLDAGDVGEVVDDDQELIVYVTIYEPHLDRWQPGFRERRQ